MEKIHSYSEFVSATYEQCMERMRREFRRHNALK